MASATPPGLRPARLLHLIRRSIDVCRPDLRGATVLTEAATGAYVVTPVIAALAGAREVHAVTRATRYGSVEDVVAQTQALAVQAGVADRIWIHAERRPELFAAADVVTNSGHLRPLDAGTVALMRPDAVVPLMFEAWEIDLGRHDVDLEALRARGIRFAGTNERHPAVDVFGYLGPMAVRLLHDGGITARGAVLALLCDNPFRPYLVQGLEAAGATVRVLTDPDGFRATPDLDAVVVATAPTGRSALTQAQIADIAAHAPGAGVAQFWGDLDRRACAAADVWCLPEHEPAPGHMGILPSALGPEPVVRLQTGGLAVAGALRRTPEDRDAVHDALVDPC
jgi:hypothetical protein